METCTVNQNYRHWRMTMHSISAMLILTLISKAAFGLELGNLSIFSTLGAPLNAKIEILKISPKELHTLQVEIASQKKYAKSNIEYNKIVTGIAVLLKKSSDGKNFIQLTSKEPFNIPFIDLLIETKSATGEMIRDYTVLLSKSKTTYKPSLLEENITSAKVTTNPVIYNDKKEAVQKIEKNSPEPIKKSDKKSKPHTESVEKKGAIKTANQGRNKHLIKRGETATKIILSEKSTGASLNQMLVAILDLNPDAFEQGNVNRMRAGVVIEMPSAEDALGTSPQEARKMIITQNKNFTAYRNNLALHAVKTVQGQPAHSNRGNIEVNIADKSSVNVAPDKLTLTNTVLNGKQGTQLDNIAKTNAEKDAKEHLKELERNIASLKRIQADADSIANGVPATATEPNATHESSIGLNPTKPPAKSFFQIIFENSITYLLVAISLIALSLFGFEFFKRKKNEKTSIRSLFQFRETVDSNERNSIQETSIKQSFNDEKIIAQTTPVNEPSTDTISSFLSELNATDGTASKNTKKQIDNDKLNFTNEPNLSKNLSSQSITTDLLQASAMAEPNSLIDTRKSAESSKIKLSLAQEFIALGSIDGARTLLKEVLAETTGSLKQQAQAMIDTIAE
jgi:FimV-like protein